MAASRVDGTGDQATAVSTPTIKNLSPLEKAVVCEGLIVGDAALMSIRPKAAAIVLAIIAPIGLEGLDDDLSAGLGYATLEGLAAYQAFGMDMQDRYVTRFGRSLIAWHVAAGILYELQNMSDRRTKKQQVFLIPDRDGAEIRLVRRF